MSTQTKTALPFFMSSKKINPCLLCPFVHISFIFRPLKFGFSSSSQCLPNCWIQWTVPHWISSILDKAGHSGFSDTAISWFLSYLSDQGLCLFQRLRLLDWHFKSCFSPSARARFSLDLLFLEWSCPPFCVWYSHFRISNPDLFPKLQTYVCNRLLDKITWKSLKSLKFHQAQVESCILSTVRVMFIPSTVLLVEVTCIVIRWEGLSSNGSFSTF